jgi:hypothetical protein
LLIIRVVFLNMLHIRYFQVIKFKFSYCIALLYFKKGEEKSMRKKIFGILICMLFIDMGGILSKFILFSLRPNKQSKLKLAIDIHGYLLISLFTLFNVLYIFRINNLKFSSCCSNRYKIQFGFCQSCFC